MATHMTKDCKLSCSVLISFTIQLFCCSCSHYPLKSDSKWCELDTALMWTSCTDKQDVTSSTLGSKQRHGGHICEYIQLRFSTFCAMEAGGCWGKRWVGEEQKEGVICNFYILQLWLFVEQLLLLQPRGACGRFLWFSSIMFVSFGLWFPHSYDRRRSSVT